jgi:hypothetical protein
MAYAVTPGEQPAPHLVALHPTRNEAETVFSEDATSEIQDPAPTAHLRIPKRKRGKATLSYQREMISLENRKLE